MELLKWRAVGRKRRNDLPFADPAYVRGYDLDMADFTLLVDRYNAGPLSRPDESRLFDHVMTMLNIVLENPKINPLPGEMDGLSDRMFLDMWNALHYIRSGTRPYSYVYRAGYTAACNFFKQQIREREKEEAIEKHLAECFAAWQDECSTHKVTNFSKE